MGSVRPHAFIEIRLIEIVRPRNVHIVEACYLDRCVSTLARELDFSPTLLHYGDLGSAVEA